MDSQKRLLGCDEPLNVFEQYTQEELGIDTENPDEFYLTGLENYQQNFPNIVGNEGFRFRDQDPYLAVVDNDSNQLLLNIAGDARNLSSDFSSVATGDLERLSQLTDMENSAANLLISPPDSTKNYMYVGNNTYQEPYYVTNQSKYQGGAMPRPIMGRKVEAESQGGGSNSDSSQESQTERVPILDPFHGPYDFHVELGEKALPKKCVYRADINKIYCIDEHGIMFHFFMDFKNAPLKKLKLEAVVYFTSGSLATKSLAQCDSCCENEVQFQISNRQETTNAIQPFGHQLRPYHGCIVRCEHLTTKYGVKRGIHNCCSALLETPQPGAQRIMRNYSFHCMNSCQKWKDSRHWTLVFYLMEGKNEVGRDSFNLKVCKCPGRDAKTEKQKPLPEYGAASTNISPHTILPLVTTDQLERDSRVAAAATQSRLDMPQTDHAGPSNARDQPGKLDIPEGSCSQATNESLSQCDSQNTHEYMDTLKTNALHMHGIARHHPDPKRRRLAKLALGHISSFNSTCKYYNEYELQEETVKKEDQPPT